MVSAKFMKGAQTPNVMDNANDDVDTPEADSMWERAMDGDDDQMEQIEKMMRPLTQVHPAAIIAGTIIAGAIVVILVFRLMQKNSEMRERMESKRKSQIEDEDQILNGAFSVNSVEAAPAEMTTTASVDDSELSLTESAAEEAEDGVAKPSEDAKAAEAAKIAEEQAKAAEAVRIAEEEAIASEAARIVEQHKAAEDARLAEEEAKAAAKLAEETKAAARLTLAEEATAEEEKAEAAAATAGIEDRTEHLVAATPVADQPIKAEVSETSEVGPTALLNAEKENSSSNESFEHLEPEDEEEPVSAEGNLAATKEAPKQDAVTWLRELAEEIPREENEKDDTNDEGEESAKSTLTVSLEAKPAEETVVDDGTNNDVIEVASKEEVSVKEDPMVAPECHDDDDAMLESDGADFRNVNVKEMKECLVATSDDEKESRV